MSASATPIARIVIEHDREDDWEYKRDVEITNQFGQIILQEITQEDDKNMEITTHLWTPAQALAIGLRLVEMARGAMQ